MRRTELSARLHLEVEACAGYRALAAAIGISVNTLTGIIRCEHEPSRETITLIAAHVDVVPWIVEKWSRTDAGTMVVQEPPHGSRGGQWRAAVLSKERIADIARRGACARNWRPSAAQMALPGVE